MRGITRLVRGAFVKQAERTLEAAEKFRRSQERELTRLLRQGRATRWGHRFGMDSIAGYDEYRKKMPIVAYEDIRAEVMNMIHGEKDVLWPGRTFRFAQSSGTSDGKSKYIPITEASLAINHYRGGKESVAHYLRQKSGSQIFDGKAFILGGSFANELHPEDSRVKIGDLSANLIEAINPLVNILRVPSKKVALLEDWSEKLPALVSSASKENITNISGVPSWFLTVLREVIKKNGAHTIHDVWPNLEVFFHGGIAFGPYREQYEGITDPARMNYLETYNASEGFFAVQTDFGSHAIMLLPDAGIFYEFIPVDGDDGDIVPAWGVNQGATYALVISACNGLWRYKIGDVVRIETVNPLRITIAGRTKNFINAFGEEVMVYNTDNALEKTCRETDIGVKNYTVAPIFAVNGQKGRHQWMIEFDKIPDDVASFARRLDQNLQKENSDYQAKRQGGIFLDCLSIEVAKEGLFDLWLLHSGSGKLGGQRKVPRLSNDRKIMDELLKINET